MNEGIVELTTENFETEVIQSDRPVLVDFWAEWCAPCRMLAPTIDEIAQDYADQIKVGKLNVDQHGDIAARFAIRGIPTILVFHQGAVHDQMVGAGSKENILKMVEKVASGTEAPA